MSGGGVTRGEDAKSEAVTASGWAFPAAAEGAAEVVSLRLASLRNVS